MPSGIGDANDRLSDVAGAMAGGEYTSVSAQKDTEQAALAMERWELRNLPDEELRELADLYRQRGLSPELATQVAVELTGRDALAAHAEVELGIDADQQTNPWHAAISSFIAFATGATLPLLAIVLPTTTARVPVTMTTVVIATDAGSHSHRRRRSDHHGRDLRRGLRARRRGLMPYQ